MAGFHVPAGGRVRLNGARPATPVVNIALCRPWLVEEKRKAEPVKRAVWSKPVVREVPLSTRKELERERNGSPTLAAIIRTVSLVTNVRQMDLKSARRHAPQVKARQIIFWLAKRDTTLSFPQIGRMLGGRDHTTVLHGLERVQDVIEHLGLSVPDDVAAAAELLWRADWPALKAINHKT